MRQMMYNFTVYEDKLFFQCDNKKVFEEAKTYIERLLDSEAYRGIPARIQLQPDDLKEYLQLI